MFKVNVLFSGEDEFILPDVDSQNLDPGQVDIKPEVEDVKLFAVPVNVGDSCDEKPAPVQIKEEPSDFDSSVLTYEPGLENNEMELDNHGPTTCCEDFLQVQLSTTNQGEIGTREEHPTLQAESEEFPIGQEHTSKEYGLLKGVNCFMTGPIEEMSEHNSEEEEYINMRNPDINTSVMDNTCLHCNKDFLSLEDLRNNPISHERVHLLNKCCQCSETFPDINTLKNHMNTHILDKSKVCAKRSKYELNLNTDNLKIWPDCPDRPHKCRLCGKGFRQKNHVYSHMLTHSVEKPHQCSQCGKAFRRKNHFNTHMLSHTGEKPHVCSQCGKAFHRKSHLNTHMLSHSAEKPHKCIQCGKAFHRKSYLDSHMLSHTSEKPHDCGECGKAFQQKYQLYKHMLTHTTEKPHECSLCDKAFRQKSHLTIHMLSHSAEKPHQCGECGKTFRQKSHMTIHHCDPFAEKKAQSTSNSELNLQQLSESGEKPHKCNECGHAFMEKSKLKRHISLHCKNTKEMQ